MLLHKQPAFLAWAAEAQHQPKPSPTRGGCDEAQVVLHLLDVLPNEVGHHGEVLVQQAAESKRCRAHSVRPSSAEHGMHS